MAQNLETGLSIKGLTADTNTLQIRNSSNNTTFIVDNTGNVGIGTSTPTAKLHIYDTTLFSGGTRLLIDTNTGNSGINNTGLHVKGNLDDSNNSFVTLFEHTNPAGSTGGGSILRVKGGLSQYGIGTVYKTDALDISSYGHVSVGSIVDSSSGKAKLFNVTFNDTNSVVWGGTETYAGYLENTKTISGFTVSGFGEASKYGLRVESTGYYRPDNSNYKNYGLFVNVDSGSGSGTSYSAIFNGGNLGIGTSTPTERLDVNGKTKTTNLQVTNGGATAGYVLTATDNLGNMSWQAPTGGGGGGGTFTGGTVAGGTSFTNGLTANTFTIGGVTYNSLTNLDDTTNLGTGITIHFSARTIFNLPDSPASGNISGDTTNAKFGMVQKIYHQSSIEPTFQSNWKLIGEGVYFTNQLNIIYAEYITNSRIEYWIIQEY